MHITVSVAADAAVLPCCRCMRMSIMVVAAAFAADRSDQSDIVCAHHKCGLYNTMSFAAAAYAGCSVDGGNGN